MLEKLSESNVEVNSLKKKYIDLFIKELKNRNDMISKIKEIRLFGSVLTKRCREDSDIDICIILNNTESSHEFRLKYVSNFMLDLYNLGFNTKCDRIVFTEDEYKAEIGRHGVVDDIEKYGRLIYGGSE